MYKKFIFPTFSIISLFFLLCCNQKTEEVSTRPQPDFNTVSVVVEAVSSYNESESIHTIGIVSSESDARPAFKTGGIIFKTYAKEGDYVKRGQLLATLIMTEINAQVKQAEEAMIKAERDLMRIQNLYKDSVATLEQLQNITTALEVSKRSFEIAQFNRQYSEVRSPIAGRIIKQLLHEGEVAAPGMPVFAIMGVSSRDWKITAGLAERDWARIKTSDQATVIFDGWPDTQFQAFVSEKTSVGRSNSGTLDITLKLKTQPTDLAAGMVCTLEIKPSESKSMTVIPIEALVKTNGNRATIFTVEDGLAKKINIQIGNILGGQVRVISGLEKIAEVITIGAVYLEDGDKVTIVNK